MRSLIRSMVMMSALLGALLGAVLIVASFVQHERTVLFHRRAGSSRINATAATTPSRNSSAGAIKGGE